jgi:hypothetical protein
MSVECPQRDLNPCYRRERPGRTLPSSPQVKLSGALLASRFYRRPPMNTVIYALGGQGGGQLTRVASPM